jgi:hypothetical protein
VRPTYLVVLYRVRRGSLLEGDMHECSTKEGLREIMNYFLESSSYEKLHLWVDGKLEETIVLKKDKGKILYSLRRRQKTQR